MERAASREKSMTRSPERETLPVTAPRPRRPGRLRRLRQETGAGCFLPPHPACSRKSPAKKGCDLLTPLAIAAASQSCCGPCRTVPLSGTGLALGHGYDGQPVCISQLQRFFFFHEKRPPGFHDNAGAFRHRPRSRTWLRWSARVHQPAAALFLFPRKASSRLP